MGNEASKGSGGSKDKNSKTSTTTKNKKEVPVEKPKQEDFELLQTLGKGSYGKVMLVRYKKDQKLYAMKILKKVELLKRKAVLNTQTERRVLEDTNNPFLVSLRYAFQTDDKLYMILDFCAGGELFYHLKQQGCFSETLTRLYAAEIILGLQALHEQRIIYRDMKPENILLDEEGHCKITDFGLAKELDADGMLRSLCGTPEYIAPEIIKPTPQGYNQAVDYWSLGTMLYEFITGLPPFYSQQQNVMYEKIVKSPLSWPQNCKLSPEGRDFIGGLLQKQPERRLGMGEGGVKEIENHPWFKDINWKDVYDKKIEFPFKPNMAQKQGDAPHVDEQFLKAPVVDTPLDTKQTRKINFPQFTYKGEGEGEKMQEGEWEKV